MVANVILGYILFSTNVLGFLAYLPGLVNQYLSGIVSKYLSGVVNKYLSGIVNKYLFCRITQLFATHKEDRKRVHLALKSVNLPCESKDNISSEDFTFQHFLTFYLNLCERTELNEIFNKL